jgi:hypothetical protein
MRTPKRATTPSLANFFTLSGLYQKREGSTVPPKRKFFISLFATSCAKTPEVKSPMEHNEKQIIFFIVKEFI